MRLRDDGLYRDPQSGQECSAAVVFAHPGDNFASRVLELASALPVLDQLCTYLASGQPLSFRNMWAGVSPPQKKNRQCRRYHKEALLWAGRVEACARACVWRELCGDLHCMRGARPHRCFLWALLLSQRKAPMTTSLQSFVF